MKDMTINKINLPEKFTLIQDYWNPRIASELNGQMVKLVKFIGEFVWHKHDHEDQMFLVVQGEFDMEFRDRTETIRENEFIIVPKGVEHRPVAHTECSVLLFEPATTLNTGDVHNERTREVLERI